PRPLSPRAPPPPPPHGKLARAALRDPGEEDLLRTAEHEAPASPLEQELAQMWTELLGVTEIGRHDDFFVIGGHFALAAPRAPRRRGPLGVDVPLRRIFEAPVLADLAEAILEGQLADDHDAAAAPAALPPTLRPLLEGHAR